MAKKTRKYNPNLIKARHSYSFAEIAEVYKIHAGTPQNWRKQGLKAINETSSRLLFLGLEIRRFLTDRAQKRKHPLKLGEFFCPKCRGPRKSVPECLSAEITNKPLGKITNQAFIRGKCEVCNTALLLFSSDRKVQESKEKGLILLEHRKTISGIEDSSLNTNITRG